MANNNTYVLKLDIKEQQPNLPIKIVQNDTVFLNIELYDAGQKMDLKEGEQFVVSTINEETQEKNSGIAKYDGHQFVVYEMRKADMRSAGNYVARFSSYKDRHRVSSLSFRYTVYEDLEHIGGSDEELTLLHQIFMQLEETGKVAQRQGEYAEDRGDYANAAGDYANDSAASNMLNWLNYVNTLADRSNTYPNPNNGDTVFVIQENAVYRYDGIDSMSWEKIQGWDATVIQQIYALKEDKSVVAKLREDFEKLTIGGRNLIRKYDFTGNTNYHMIQKLGGIFETGLPMFKITVTATGANPPINMHNGNNKFKVLPRQNVVGSVWVKNETGTASSNITLRLYENSASATVSTTDSTVVTAEGWKRISVSYYNDTNSEKELSLYAYSSNSVGNSILLTSPKVEHGNRPTDWSPSFEDIASDIANHEDRIATIENEVANNVVKKSVYEQDKATNAQKFSQITQSATELSSVVSKKVGANEVKSIINQTAESVKIKASNIDFDGATAFRTSSNTIDPNSFVSIKNGELLIKGKYQRIWRDGVLRDRIQQTHFKNGYMQMTDPKGDLIDSATLDFWNDHNTKVARSLYYTSDGISTYRDGTGKYTVGDGSGTGNYVASGTLEFFSHEYSKTRGVTLLSAGGAVAMKAAGGSTYVDAYAQNNLLSQTGHIVLNPYNKVRNGLNRFVFGVSTNLEGYMTYGDTSKGLGAGFRFNKSSKIPTITAVDGAGKKSTKVVFEVGQLKSDNITSANGKNKVVFNGLGNGTLSSKNNLTTGGILSNGTDFYIGVNGELRVTDKRGYNNGKTIRYLPVRASKFNTVSSRKYKSNIEELTVSSLDLLRENKIKQYNLNTDLDKGVDKTKYGFILEETNETFREGDAIDLYTMASINWDASQKMLKMIEELSEKVSKLESENQRLKEQLG